MSLPESTGSSSGDRARANRLRTVTGRVTLNFFFRTIPFSELFPLMDLVEQNASRIWAKFHST